MTPLQIIAEWRKGCSQAGLEEPQMCPQCTLDAINALEKVLRESQRQREEASAQRLRDFMVAASKLGATADDLRKSLEAAVERMKEPR